MEHHQGENMGSIAKFEIITHYLISVFNPIRISPGAAWLSIPFRDQSGELKETTEDTENGLMYTYSGSIYIPNQRDEVDLKMRGYLGQRSVIRIIDMNGRVYIIGSPMLPVTLTSSGETSKTYAGENGKEFQFKVEQYFPALRL